MAYNTTKSIMDSTKASAKGVDSALSIGVNVGIGTSNSQSSSVSNVDTAAGSAIHADGNVNIVASGGDLTVRGSNIDALHSTKLEATKGQVLLQAAENTYSQQGSSSSSNKSVSVSAGYNFATSSYGLELNISAAGSNDTSNGSEHTWTNTHVSGGDSLTLTSGGDTVLKGAVVSGKTITGHLGGDLILESLQDTNAYQENGSNFGASISIPI